MKIKKHRHCDFSELLGCTIVSVRGFDKNSDEILFKLSDGRIFKMFHDQECCEEVHIDDIVGDVEDIIGSPVLIAEEASNQGDSENTTWTFYKLATIKGYVTIRWYGQSNGYYSEKANFAEVEQEYDYNRIHQVCEEILDARDVLSKVNYERMYPPIRPNRVELKEVLNQTQAATESYMRVKEKEFTDLISPIL